tara:strand:+ start:6075 stop:6185 length:111 start_codon:yes stop_codon:yes gene_type:complete
MDEEITTWDMILAGLICAQLAVIIISIKMLIAAAAG